MNKADWPYWRGELLAVGIILALLVFVVPLLLILWVLDNWGWALLAVITLLLIWKGYA